MRNDAVGMFWDDTPPPKVVKEKEKATPPERTWERPDYLPGLAEALAYPYPEMSDAEIMQAQRQRHPLIFDVETFPNYFLAGFTDYVTGKVMTFEYSEELDWYTDIDKLRWVLTSFQTVGFNSLGYDLPITEYMLAGAGNADLKTMTDRIILTEERGDDILHLMKLQRLKVDHVDLIEVAPLRANLKIYGGRLHTPRMQDLPFPPDQDLTREQMAIVKMYNVNADLVSTALMYRELKGQIELRESLSTEYGVDLRSKSDAQIAEAVIRAEVTRINRRRIQKPKIEPGRTFYYQPPAYIRFETPLLNNALSIAGSAPFIVDMAGRVGLPKTLEELELLIGKATYNMGVGGLHSSEKRQVHFSDADFTLYDRDVTSYYPSMLINSGMYPPQLGPAFQTVYQGITARRVVAKKNKQKVIADSLKITANGTFGKTGSPHSILYMPEMMIWTTLTGQLSLLMLIERFELAGMEVVSGNTDGITIKVPNSRKQEYLDIIAQWELDTGLTTEEAVYAALYIRDVNNYIAVKPDGKVKAKGAYSNPWADPELAIFRFHKNPVNLVCTEAVEAYVTKGIMPDVFITGCNDIRKFITVRTVKGGGVKVGDGENEYLGKSIRWYYSNECKGHIVYAKNGNRVPRTEGARPALELPEVLPADLDFGWYIKEACDMIRDLGLESPLGAA